MSRPPDIIAFSKDWREPKTSNNHVLEEMSQRHRVLWVNSIATRAPNLASGHDIKKILRRLRHWLRGAEHIHENFRVLTPLLLPLPRLALAQKFNRWFVTAQVRAAAKQWGFEKPQLWIFPPNAVDFVGQFDESLVVYYCTDEWSQFHYVNAELMQQKEAALLRQADVVIVVSEKLYASRISVNSNTHIIPHGVDFKLFSCALDSHYEIPDDIRSLSPPVIGFYGNLYDWVDQDLIVAIARERPNWSFVLIGKIMSDVAKLRGYGNIHLLGPRAHKELPHYCKKFDVGIIPYRMQDPRMQSVNPLKLREFLAAGVPVVSVDMREVRVLLQQERFVSDIVIASNRNEFIASIEKLLAHETAEKRRQRSMKMQNETWEARGRQIEQILSARSSRTNNV